METNLISIRRHEVEQAIARLRQEIEAFEAELIELATAERVIARLSGASRPDTGKADEQATAIVRSPAAEPKLSMPEMIEIVLREHQSEFPMSPGLEPKQISAKITEKFGIVPRPDAVSPICWRMWKRGQLYKGKDSSDYRLFTEQELKDRAERNEKYEHFLAIARGEAPEEKAPDAQSSPDTSEALDQPEAQGREAGPGGGA